MDIQEYLKYHNIALIDNTSDFGSSCIQQYESRGYLTSKQLNVVEVDNDEIPF